ncbi:hypothetical protein N9D96_04200 [Gammaproteobacteria bacterium]|nr:hypothetical protein [Gammaproteobacteria bacterium]
MLFLVFIIIVSIFFVSNMIGIIMYGTPDLTRLVFLYKYLFIFVLPWVFVAVVRTDEQIKIINKLILINFILLSSWTYIYLILLNNGSISGSLRPSFPFSNDYSVTDAHLYSSYLGFFLVTYIFYLRNFFSHNLITSFLFGLNGLVALVLTGSRTGLVLIILGILFYLLYSFFRLFFKKNNFLVQKNRITYLFIFFLTASLLTVLMIPNIITFILNSTDVINLYSRAFNFRLATDISSLDRIEKLGVGFQDAENAGLFLGLGLRSSFTWYDGILALLISHGGLLFILFIYFFYYLIVKKAAINSVSQKDFLLFALLIFLYLIANVITEYIFVTRSAFPVLVMLSTLFVNIFNKRRKLYETILDSN